MRSQQQQGKSGGGGEVPAHGAAHTLQGLGSARVGTACFQARRASSWEPSCAQSHGLRWPPRHVSRHSHGWALHRRDAASDTPTFRKEPPGPGMREVRLLTQAQLGTDTPRLQVQRWESRLGWGWEVV